MTTSIDIEKLVKDMKGGLVIQVADNHQILPEAEEIIDALTEFNIETHENNSVRTYVEKYIKEEWKYIVCPPRYKEPTIVMCNRRYYAEAENFHVQFVDADYVLENYSNNCIEIDRDEFNHLLGV